MKEKALRELASIFNPAANLPQGETPLLVAVGAVGKALGITIRPPAKSENLSGFQETLLGIARASGFRIRRVTLTPNWWKTDCGSLVAFTQAENRPVALLRVKATQYEILDSVELTRTPVNRQTATKWADNEWFDLGEYCWRCNCYPR